MVIFINMLPKQAKKSMRIFKKETLQCAQTIPQMEKDFVPVEKIILLEFMMRKLNK